MSSRAVLRGALRRGPAPLTAGGARPAPASLRVAAAPALAPRRGVLGAAVAPASSSSSAASETAFGILQSLEARQAEDDPDAGKAKGAEGQVLSNSGGLLRVSLSGRVAVGDALELPAGLGLVLRFDKRGAIVAVVSGAVPRTGDSVRAVGVLELAPWLAGGTSEGLGPIVGAAELLRARGGETAGAAGAAAASGLLVLPAMRPVPSRRPVSTRMPSGLATAEALLPLAEGHRIALVGPPTTGKTRAAGMLIRSQSPDTAVVYAAQRSAAVLQHSLGEGVLDRQNLHILHADPAASSACLRYLLPLAAVQLADRLRSRHRHVLLVLDDLVAFSQAASELGVPPLGAPHVVAAALDAAGNVATGEGVRALSVAVVADFDPEEIELHPTLRGLWRSLEPSVDVCLPFSLQLAADGILPAVDVDSLLACGPAPMYQAPFFKAMRGELIRTLIANRDRRERLTVSRELGLHVEPQDQEEQGSAAVARALFKHSASRPLPEVAVLMTAALVFHFPQRGRKPSASAVAMFQDGVLNLMRNEYPGLWGTLQHVEELSAAEADDTLQQLAMALLQHRFNFRLTRPDL